MDPPTLLDKRLFLALGDFLSEFLRPIEEPTYEKFTLCELGPRFGQWGSFLPMYLRAPPPGAHMVRKPPLAPKLGYVPPNPNRKQNPQVCQIGKNLVKPATSSQTGRNVVNFVKPAPSRQGSINLAASDSSRAKSGWIGTAIEKRNVERKPAVPNGTMATNPSTIKRYPSESLKSVQNSSDKQVIPSKDSVDDESLDKRIDESHEMILNKKRRMDPTQDYVRENEKRTKRDPKPVKAELFDGQVPVVEPTVQVELTQVLSEARDLKRCAANLMNRCSTNESMKLYFCAGLKFMQAASIREPENFEAFKPGDAAHCIQLYADTAQLFEYCSEQFENVKDMVGVSLSYKCVEVALMKAAFFKKPATTLESAPRVPSTSILDYANYMTRAFEASEKAHLASSCIIHEVEMQAIRKSLDFGFWQVGEFINLVRNTMNFISR